MRPRLIPTLALLLLPLASSSSSTSLKYPAKKEYETHHYYSLSTPSYTSPKEARELAREVGAEWVEQVGELQGVWLVRAAKRGMARRAVGSVDERTGREEEEEDHEVLRRWDSLQAQQRGIQRRNETPASTIRDVQHLPIRQRIKREYNAHLQNERQDPPSTPAQNLTELHYVQDQLGLSDPLLPAQWHLINTQLPEVELNVTALWGAGVTGEGVKVAIVDDGLDMDSEDLEGNFYAEGSYDFNDHDPLPRPRLSDDQHGTRCAGEIAAAPNDVCGVGVAYTAKISGIRILSAPISDADEAAALNYEYQKNDVYSCSWGPPDDGKSMDAPEGLILKAMVNGVQKGRGGKGSVFVFAAGNGGGLDDQCNFDGYTNSIFSLTIGAVDRKGLHPYYSEMCAAMIVVAPSSGSGDHIHTTDVGKRACTSSHGGTSAAAPLAAGVAALALQARPELSWRDLQHVLIHTAVHFNPEDPDWEKTARGRWFSYKYGYGRIDAGAVVEEAKRWGLVKPQAWFDSPAVFLGEREGVVGKPQEGEEEDDGDEDQEETRKRQDMDGVVIDDDQGEPETTMPDQTTDESDPIAVDTPAIQAGLLITENGIESSFEVTREMLDDANFETLEHVTTRVWIDHQRRGDVEVELTSPNGVSSVLARQRRFDEDPNGFQGWKFMSMKHWGEDPVGIWKIRVKDQVNPDKVGYFKSWSLQLWGEVVDPAEARDWSPAESSESDEEQVGSNPSGTVSQKPKPTDHLPDDHGSAEGEAHEPGLGNTKPTSGPDVAVGPGADEAVVGEDGSIDYGADGSSWYDSGVHVVKEHKTWLAGGGGLFFLAIIAAGAGFWFLRVRRKRKMMQDLSVERGSYEPVAEEVPMGLLGSRKRGSQGGPGSKDLYDAFAENDLTEDEDDDEDDRRGGETAQLKYHDDFLGDDEEDGPTGSRGAYRDEQGQGKRTSPEQGSSSTSSWQDADPRARSPAGI